MDLKALQREAHAIAKEHGWWDEERTFGDCIAKVHSDLSEALEAYREHGLTPWKSHTYSDGFKDGVPDYMEGKPEGVASELADVVIWVADMAEWYEIDATSYINWLTAYELKQLERFSFGEWIALLHSLLSEALFASHKWPIFQHKANPVAVNAWVHKIGNFIGCIQRMAAHYGIDLDAAIAAKMEYNRHRSYRHGGKAL